MQCPKMFNIYPVKGCNLQTFLTNRKNANLVLFYFFGFDKIKKFSFNDLVTVFANFFIEFVNLRVLRKKN